jgi:uncharacterized protein YebE (UPF0316 family)
MFAFGALPPLASAVLIFFLRVGDMSLDTMRMLFVVRGQRKLAWVLGFCQSVIFVVAISSVLANLGNWLNVIGYAAGFATGTVVGMTIERRLAIGHTQLTVISSMRGTSVAEKLRDFGYAVTEIPARGKDGTVSVLHVSVIRKDLQHVESVIQAADPAAFVSAEDMRPLRRGFFRA